MTVDAQLRAAEARIAELEEYRKAWRSRALGLRSALEAVIAATTPMLAVRVTKVGVIVSNPIRERIQSACNDATRIIEDEQVVDVP